MVEVIFLLYFPPLAFPFFRQRINKQTACTCCIAIGMIAITLNSYQVRIIRIMLVIGSRSRPIKLNRCFSGNLHPFLRLDIDMRYCRTQIVRYILAHQVLLCFLSCFYGISLHIHISCIAIEIESHSPLIIHIAVRHISSGTCRLSKRIFCFVFQFGRIEHIRCTGNTCSNRMIYLLCVTRCFCFCRE